MEGLSGGDEKITVRTPTIQTLNLWPSFHTSYRKKSSIRSQNHKSFLNSQKIRVTQLAGQTPQKSQITKISPGVSFSCSVSDKVQLKETPNFVLATDLPTLTCGGASQLRSSEGAPDSNGVCSAGATGLAVSSNLAFLLLKASFPIRVLSVGKPRPIPDTPVSSEHAATT